MKILTPLAAILIFFVSGCHKSHINTDPGCSCNTDSIADFVTYNSFIKYTYTGSLEYISNGTQPGWYVSAFITDSNYYGNAGICKICNPDLAVIKTYTDTSFSTRITGIPVRFAGSLKKLCKNEIQTFGLATLPETIFFYITIDSLQKQ